MEPMQAKMIIVKERLEELNNGWEELGAEIQRFCENPNLTYGRTFLPGEVRIIKHYFDGFNEWCEKLDKSMEEVIQRAISRGQIESSVPLTPTFDELWKNVCKDKGLGHYAPDTHKGKKSKKEKPQDKMGSESV